MKVLKYCHIGSWLIKYKKKEMTARWIIKLQIYLASVFIASYYFDVNTGSVVAKKLHYSYVKEIQEYICVSHYLSMSS